MVPNIMVIGQVITIHPITTILNQMEYQVDILGHGMDIQIIIIEVDKKF